MSKESAVESALDDIAEVPDSAGWSRATRAYLSALYDRAHEHGKTEGRAEGVEEGLAKGHSARIGELLAAGMIPEEQEGWIAEGRALERADVVASQRHRADAHARAGWNLAAAEARQSADNIEAGEHSTAGDVLGERDAQVREQTWRAAAQLIEDCLRNAEHYPEGVAFSPSGLLEAFAEARSDLAAVVQELTTGRDRAATLRGEPKDG